MAGIKCDLSDLKLYPGTYSVQVKATASGCFDSPLSSVAAYEVLPKLSGTWRFKETIEFPDDILEEKVNFTIDMSVWQYDGSGTGIVIGQTVINNETEKEVLCIRYYGKTANGKYEWWLYNYLEDTGWENDTDRTVTFVDEQVVSIEFYEWFRKNAVWVSS